MATARSRLGSGTSCGCHSTGLCFAAGRGKHRAGRGWLERAGHHKNPRRPYMTPLWFSIIGALLVLMSLIGLAVNRLPLTSGLIYLLIGVALGPLGFGILNLDVEKDSGWLLSAFELTV